MIFLRTSIDEIGCMMDEMSLLVVSSSNINL